MDIEWLPAMRSLVTHLEQQGHKRICFMIAAMNMLLDRMNGIKTESIRLAGSLIIRASTCSQDPKA